MPKLNVQQNNQNIIQAFRNALAIGNLKGIIASDGNHNFSTAGSNRNLLDNPWFTVRQRGNGPFVTQYSADRWYAAGGGLQVTLGDGGATLAFSATYREFRQTIVNPTYYANGTYTMSVKVTGYTSSGSIRMQVHDGAGTSLAQFTFKGNGIHHYTFTTGANGIGRLGLYNITNADATLTIEAVKLEHGSVSTLANDVPPNYAEELAKCQRYLMVYNCSGSVGAIGFAYAHATTNATAVITLPVSMRATPTISVVNSIALQQGTVRYNLTSPTGPALNGNVLTFTSPYTVVSGAAAAGTVGALLLRENATLTISAEP